MAGERPMLGVGRGLREGLGNGRNVEAWAAAHLGDPDTVVLAETDAGFDLPASPVGLLMLNADADAARAQAGRLAAALPELEPFSPSDAAVYLSRLRPSGAEYEVVIDLGLGRSEERVWTCDLSEEYVRINGKYTT